MNRKIIAVIALSLSVGFLVPDASFADSTTTSTDTAESNPAVTEWFAKYDQIRRDAEMATSEKLKYGSAMKKALNAGAKVSPGTKEFMKRMSSKYEAASAAMSALTPTPETKELHDGYLQYFDEMGKSFSAACASEENADSADSAAKSETKDRIEALDNANKKIDAKLRQRFGIPKHKRS